MSGAGGWGVVGVGLERGGARWGPSEKRRPQLLLGFFFLEDLRGILAGLHLQQRPCSCCLCFARGEVATFSP